MRHFTTAAGERATARHDVSRRLGQLARHVISLRCKKSDTVGALAGSGEAAPPLLVTTGPPRT
jgi:hypothetical protein